jgi:small conductance mechanosensitive channel
MNELIQKNMPQVIELGQGILQCLLILVVGWMVSGWVRRLTLDLLDRRKVDGALSKFLSQLAYYFVLAASLIAALGTVGIETTSVVALLGSAGVAIGLALQGNLSHLASGVMILFFRPFTLEDVITAGGHTGAVKEIGLFATTLHTPDNLSIILPNGSITSGTIVNHSSLGIRCAAVAVTLASTDKLDEAIELLGKASVKAPKALSTPAPIVGISAVHPDSVEFTILVWCKAEDFILFAGGVRKAVLEDLRHSPFAGPPAIGKALRDALR